MKDFSELVVPEGLRYAKDHEWISPIAPHRIGISDYAQDQLGDLTYVELPEIGTEIGMGNEFGSLESIKSVSTLFMPASGRVLAVNETLRDDPGLVNRDPYGEGWLVEIEPADPAQFDALMTSDIYHKRLKDNA